MPGTTPYHNWPVMLDTDPMANVAQAMRNLGNAIDGGSATVGGAGVFAAGCRYRLSAGIVTAYFDSVASGAWAANAPITAALPLVARPPVRVYGFVINRTTGAPLAVYVDTTGTLNMMLAGGGAGQGPLGAITFVQ